VRERIEYRFRVPSAAVFTLYSYSKALEYRFRVPTADSLRYVKSQHELYILYVSRGCMLIFVQKLTARMLCHELWHA
jgi:hypothetical protein